MNGDAFGPWAHSGNDLGEWHTLVDHLRATGDLASRFAEPFGGSSLAKWLGRSHDIGKTTCAWQEALTAAAETSGPTGVTHKKHAARLARRVGGHPSHIQALLAGAALLGHHSGIPDNTSSQAGVLTTLGVLNDASLDAEIRDAVATMSALGLGNLDSDAEAVTLPDWLPLGAQPADHQAMRRLDVFTRMTFSALVDADYLDTEGHFDATARPRISQVTDFSELFAEFQSAREELLGRGRPSPVDSVRRTVYDQALSMADQPPGLFRLPAPTGSGKTLTVAGFALKHAAFHGKRRVVIAVPFTSITTQNAAVYRAVLDRNGERRVLEHHSAIMDGEAGTSRWRRLAAQNWDAPFIVTTTVQLFDSLLSNKPSKARRLHRLAGAVIVLDEVQALPAPYCR